MLWFIPVICLAMLLIATFTDIKSLEVPDWLTHGGIALGIILAVISSLINWSIWPLISSIAGLAITFAIACLMFYTGQWGGGDAKLLMALGAITGFEYNPFSFGVSFLINLIFIGGIWGLIWSIGRAIRSRGKTWASFKKIRKEKQYRRMLAVSRISAILCIVISFFFCQYLDSTCVSCRSFVWKPFSCSSFQHRLIHDVAQLKAGLGTLQVFLLPLATLCPCRR
ncbi:MAG: prepilin peptidase [Candidatus Yonathbacteria bacterium]|nr:prepilin peptidase [Candidatus Yonathbacteria bacterium]